MLNAKMHQKDIKLFGHETNKDEICQLVDRSHGNELTKAEINKIVKKTVQVFYAIAFLKKKYGKRSIGYNIVLADEENLRNYPPEILDIAIEAINEDRIKKQNLENIVSLFSQKIK